MKEEKYKGRGKSGCRRPLEDESKNGEN